MAGAVHKSDTPVLPGVAVRPVGAPGTEEGVGGAPTDGGCTGGGNGAVGVADATADTGPVPAELTALIRNWYAVPFVRPVTVADVVVLVPSLNVLHELALVVLYCMV